MQTIMAVGLKVLLTFIIVYLAGLVNVLILGNEVRGNRPFPFPLSIITIVLIFLVWRYKGFFKANTSLNQEGETKIKGNEVRKTEQFHTRNNYLAFIVIILIGLATLFSMIYNK